LLPESVPPLPTSCFDFPVPEHLIARTPAAQRDASRLLVVDRASRKLEHRTFAELGSYLRPGDILVRNNAAVLPARLRALRPTGGQVECLLLQASGPGERWRCLVRPGRKLAPGATFAAPGGEFTGRIEARLPDGTAEVSFQTAAGEPLTAVANRIGAVPLPPYIERARTAAGEHHAESFPDRERYQTVYAEPARQVAAAAPTAGLHFTPQLLAQLAAAGIETADLTLHVGLGTFQPIATEHVEDHAIHREVYELPVATQARLFPPLAGRRVGVGTTSVRTIEDFLARHAAPLAQTCVAEAGIYIVPPREFRGVDALITNFHQPRSTLLCLVAAFLTPGSTAGVDWLREIYQTAIDREYRFFSYGDAMLIL
jgi:S-adenosylmethionine:tRNA ribosyltransferase-isomerase